MKKWLKFVEDLDDIPNTKNSKFPKVFFFFIGFSMTLASC